MRFKERLDEAFQNRRVKALFAVEDRETAYLILDPAIGSDRPDTSQPGGLEDEDKFCSVGFAPIEIEVDGPTPAEKIRDLAAVYSNDLLGDYTFLQHEKVGDLYKIVAGIPITMDDHTMKFPGWEIVDPGFQVTSVFLNMADFDQFMQE